MRYSKVPGGCDSAFLKTSNPPRRAISFIIDDTHYVAWVTLADVQAESIRVESPGRLTTVPSQ